MYVNMYDLPQPDKENWRLQLSIQFLVSTWKLEVIIVVSAITTVMWYVIDNDILSRVNNLRSLDDDKGVRPTTVDYKL